MVDEAPSLQLVDFSQTRPLDSQWAGRASESDENLANLRANDYIFAFVASTAAAAAAATALPRPGKRRNQWRDLSIYIGQTVPLQANEIQSEQERH